MMHRFVADAILVASLAWLSWDLGNEVGKLRTCEVPTTRLHKRMMVNMDPCSEESRALMDLLFDGEAPPAGRETLQSCKRPIHVWLNVSYVMISLARLMESFGTAFTTKKSGDFLLNLRHENLCWRRFMSLTWLFALPLYAVWTVLGTYWLYEVKVHTPQCLPEGMHSYFLIAWQVLSYIWIIIHVRLCGVACFLERCCRRVERDLNLVADADVRERWGESVGQLSSYNALPRHRTTGLTPAEISGLSRYEVAESTDDSAEHTECAVCLAVMQCGDHCRRLPRCSHAFHRPCIDLWLLRNKDCPLCKATVSPIA